MQVADTSVILRQFVLQIVHLRIFVFQIFVARRQSNNNKINNKCLLK